MNDRTLYRDMTPEQLRESYFTVRTLLANASAGNMAGSVIRLSDRLDIIVAVARKRGVSLSA